MSQAKPIAIANLLRDSVITPRVTALLELIHPALQDEFQALVDEIWADILGRLNQPIQITKTATLRSVTVLGFTRYVINRRTGLISMTCVPTSGSGRFQKANFIFSVDLPLVPSLGLFEVLLARREAQFHAYAKSPSDLRPLFSGVVSIIRRTTLQSVYWKKLRYAVRDALALDPEIMDIARRSRVNAHAREVTDRHFNFVVSHLATFRQIKADNPRLLWLLTLADLDHVVINWSGKEVLEGLRDHILKEFKLPPVAWRYLANGKRRDFRVVLDWLGPNASPKGRWFELREWLRLQVILERDKPVPLPVQRLFLHDAYKLSASTENIFFRHVQFPTPVMRQLISEAERHLASGTLRAFAENELVDVLTWLHDNGRDFDKNQIKAGWQYLVRKSTDWKHETSLVAQRDALCWESMIAEHRYGALTVRPITDVWQLYREALGMRNCTSSYLNDCLGGTVRLFAIENGSGKQIATIGLTRNQRQWEILDVRGFANVAPSGEIRALADRLAERYTMLWTTLFPVLAQTDGVPARAIIRQGEALDEDGQCNDVSEEAIAEDEKDDEDEEEEDEYYTDPEDSTDTACPICGDEHYNCEHLVAGVDYFNGGIFAGVLYKALDSLIDELWLSLESFARVGRNYSGFGAAMDKIVTSIRRKIEREEEIEDIKSDIWTDLRDLIFGLLESQSGIDVMYWEFDGGMPGCSTCGRNYWADDPESALETLRESLKLACE